MDRLFGGDEVRKGDWGKIINVFEYYIGRFYFSSIRKLLMVLSRELILKYLYFRKLILVVEMIDRLEWLWNFRGVIYVLGLGMFSRFFVFF